MKVSVWPFWMPKDGNTEEEYEDAYSLMESGEIETQQFRLAVADGASTTSFSGLWARLLACAFVNGTLDAQETDFGLSSVREEWLKAVRGKDLPWHAQEKVRLGAFSTLLGLSLRQEGMAGKWEAVAAGDSCLVQVRRGTIQKTFPLKHSEEFREHPYLIGSNPSTDVIQLEPTEGRWLPHDDFYLMTDALACWFLKETECGNRPWEALERLRASREVNCLANWVAALRRDNSMRNDDVTLLMVTVTT